MDCIGLQALSDSSESEDENLNSISDSSNNIQTDNQADDSNQLISKVELEDDPSKRKDNLYNKYKDGLKLLMKGEHIEAETLFETILNDPDIEELEDFELADEETDQCKKALIHLKYVVLKNLASINSQHKLDYSKALNHLIQAAKIDNSDLCIWYDIGDNALKLNRYLIAKLAFEQSLRIDSSYWPSLDAFIVLLYSLGNYALCLKFVFNALKMDKFYMNAIILMKKIQSFDEIYYSQQIELFIAQNYEYYGIDLDQILELTSADLYDDLFERIDYIKQSYKEQLMNKSETSTTTNNELKISSKFNTFELLGNFLLKINDKSQYNFHIPLKISLKHDEPSNTVNFVQNEDSTTSDQTKTSDPATELKQIINTNVSNTHRNSKRKKFDHSSTSFQEDTNKRRSTRGIEKFESNDNSLILKIANILKKFFDDNYFRECEQTNSPTKKNLIISQSDLIKLNVMQLKENESLMVSELVKLTTSQETSIFNLVKTYLKHLSSHYQFYQWPISLEEIYLNLFQMINVCYDLNEALINEENVDNFLELFSILLVHLEIEFNKFKDTQDKLNRTKKVGDQSLDRITYKHLHKLIFHLQTLEVYFERIIQMNHLSLDYLSTHSIADVRYFQIRMACLGLYSSLNVGDESLSSEFYKNKIHKQLSLLEMEQVANANSRIFKIISKENLKEFLKQYKKNRILKLNDQIDKMFIKCQYQEIIDQVEEFADYHRLNIEDMNFEPQIYINLVKSYFNLNQFEKCSYFCRKFLRQIVKYLNKQMNESIVDLTTNEAILTKHQNNLTEFISILVDLILNILEMNKQTTGSSNTRSSASNSGSNQNDQLVLQESVWLMSQIITIFFDNNEANLKYYELDFKPSKALKIVFECMAQNTKRDKITYLVLIHKYLAKNGFCSINNGEFLIWSIDYLMQCVTKCEICNESDETVKTESENDSSNQQATNLEAAEKENSNNDKKSKNKNSSSQKCSTCGDANDLLEQSFKCLFGYSGDKKARNKYLENHSVINIKYTLENCIDLYNYFAPDKTPEYDDKSSKSIQSEYYEFLLDILKLIHENDQTKDNLDWIKEKFLDGFQTENYDELEPLLDSLKRDHLEVFVDIYYIVGDYIFRVLKDSPDSEKYLIKDITLNRDRFDAWAELALSRSSEALIQYLEQGFNLSQMSHLEAFQKTVNISINLFRKATEYYQYDSIFWIEYGSFMYQMHSYCSRQLKLNKLVNHFVSPRISKTLEEKRIVFLNFALDAYVNANTCNNYLDETETDKKGDDEPAALKSDESNSLTLANLANQSSATTTAEAAATTSSRSKNAKKSSKSKKKQIEKDSGEEEWLHHYMLGKIKEKLNQTSFMESLSHYQKSISYLEKNNATYLKRLTYKTKGNLSVESNELYYRIYTLVLKRIDRVEIRTNNEELKAICAFLEMIMDSKFVKIHGDFQLEDISLYLVELFRHCSRQIYNIEMDELFIKSVCICIAGLNQILKRFSQHYRSLYRLAYFYAKFLDFQNYEISKNLLLSVSNWNSLPYMPCPGLFSEKNKTNFFNGIWRISNSGNKEADLERTGSFFNHLFHIVGLLIDLLEKTSDFNNLIELSKCLYQKPDQEKKYLEDTQREFLANKSLLTSLKILAENASQKFNSLNVTNFDLLPILLDTYEVYKLSTKHYEYLNESVEAMLTDFYFRFNPERRGMSLNSEELMKFCQNIERKDKASKTKPRARPVSQSQPQ